MDNNVTPLLRPMLLELNTRQWLVALGALEAAGFRIQGTRHRNRLSLVDNLTPSPVICHEFHRRPCDRNPPTNKK